ncbi:MAG: J domain-containing protein [Deltaproteobacteria bacterium]|nr:J domain-containing protein [Deltaproteobacteria bacterium]
MDAFLRTRVEIETLHELLPDLDYYRILCIDPDTPQRDVETAFRNTARALHPDRYARVGDEAFRAKVNDIFRFVNEAWRTLKDPDTRARYDAERAAGAHRISPQAQAAAAQDAVASMSLEHAARTPDGEKRWRMALKCWEDKDYRGCRIQVHFALQAEPDNPVFQEWLQKATDAANESARQNENPFMIRYG